jgi:hypothetical protein
MQVAVLAQRRQHGTCIGRASHAAAAAEHLARDDDPETDLVVDEPPQIDVSGMKVTVHPVPSVSSEKRTPESSAVRRLGREGPVRSRPVVSASGRPRGGTGSDGSTRSSVLRDGAGNHSDS